MSSPEKEMPTSADAVKGDGSREARSSIGLWLYVTVAGSLLLRLSVFDFESGDYRAFLSRWYDHFVEHGRWHGLGELAEQLPSYCYPPLYMYLISLSTLLPLPKLYAIKLLSVAVDYAAAWYVWRLAQRQFGSGYRSWAAVTAFLFLPTVVMNGALWGQCDMMYAGGLLASLFYVLERRPVAALIAFGLSISLKPQAVFWCPLLLGLFVTGRLPWKRMWIPVAVYVGCSIPAMLAGQPVGQALLRWGPAAINARALTLGAPNWYQWVFEQSPEIFWWPGVVLTLVASLMLVLVMREGLQHGFGESRWLVSLALLSVLFPPFFLPGVHERYFFAADVLSVVYAFYVPRKWVVPLLIQFASVFAYVPYLFGQEPVPQWFSAFAMLGAMGVVGAGLLEPIATAEAGGREGGA